MWLVRAFRDAACDSAWEKGRNSTLSCSEHYPSEYAAPTKESFLEEGGLLPFRRPPFLYLDVEARQAPGKSRLAPSSISAGILLSRGGVLERTTHCCLDPAQGRAFGEDQCFEGGKAWLTKDF